jgi:hypothetical protein
MTEEEISALLGRPLTPIEDTNFDTYFNIAIETLEELICTSISPVTEARTFDLREGYSTAFVDIFRTVSLVKIDGDTKSINQYSKRQWNKRTASWYNSLVFDCRFSDCDNEIEVTAEWGFLADGIPIDLQSVIAGLFDQISKKNKYDSTIASKQVEDFRISFRSDVDLDTEFSNKYSKTLSKYSLCDIPNVQHGKVC